MLRTMRNMSHMEHLNRPVTPIVGCHTKFVLGEIKVHRLHIHVEFYVARE